MGAERACQSRCARPVTPPRIGVANARAHRRARAFPGRRSVGVQAYGLRGRRVRWAVRTRRTRRAVRRVLGPARACAAAPAARCVRGLVGGSRHRGAGRGIDRSRRGHGGWWGKRRERHVHVPWTCEGLVGCCAGNTPTVVYAPGSPELPPAGGSGRAPRARTAGSRRPRAERRNAVAPRIGPLRARLKRLEGFGALETLKKGRSNRPLLPPPPDPGR